MRILSLTMLFALLTVFTCSQSFAVGNVSFLDYTLSPAVSGYVTIFASTPITVSQVTVCDTGGQIMKLASGASGSEVDLFTAPVSACAAIPVNPYLVAGTRLSVKRAGSVSPTTGANTVSLLP